MHEYIMFRVIFFAALIIMVVVITGCIAVGFAVAGRRKAIKDKVDMTLPKETPAKAVDVHAEKPEIGSTEELDPAWTYHI
jgi:hypothetical protein